MITRVRESRRTSQKRAASSAYELEPGGQYRIDNYDDTPAFSSFLPGLGGRDGMPLWCMYVNRAQGVVSFGVESKDHAIVEFLPATWAYQLVGIQGFRTFCKIDGQYYEPFQKDVQASQQDYHRTLRIAADSFELIEANRTIGLTFRVEYFSPINQPVASLVRRLTVTNIGDSRRDLQLLDGLPLILPAGFTNSGMKMMRRITEAYASVKLVCDNVPYYSAKVAAHDEAEVTKIVHGNFYAAWRAQGTQLTPIEPLVDPTIVFGDGHDLITPREFIASDDLKRDDQVWENRLPCALAPVSATLNSGESLELVATVGFAPSEKTLSDYLCGVVSPKVIDRALAESREHVASLVAPALTVSGVPVLDEYVRQNYLDNVLRGGIPMLLPSKSGAVPLHVHARRHGDLERDYNQFVLPAHPLSSGAGNYRDICQNRRSDIWFYPGLWDHEIRMFVELLQADGYNPLNVEGYRWHLTDETELLKLCPTDTADAQAAFREIVKADFQPGELLRWAAIHDIDVRDRFEWLTGILKRCDVRLTASGHTGGYWIDHWTYVTDLLEAFASVYPDQVSDLLTGTPNIQWFDEGACVLPRSEKYEMRAKGPLQLHSVVEGAPSPRALPTVTVLGKLCGVLAVKAVSFDYECRGIEMEAGRPGWNDSLNGLPALFGSSVCEAAEVANLASWLLRHLDQVPDLRFPVEVADFIEDVLKDLAIGEYCWDRAATIRENYRARLYNDVSGDTRVVPGSRLKRLLEDVETRARAAVDRSVDPETGLVDTYYISKPTLRDASDGKQPRGSADVAGKIDAFVQEPLPLYLEGQVHWLRLIDDSDRARQVYDAVRKSPIYDSSLKMYKICECLDRCGPEIGRARTFSRGWFENESVWIHMSYKYLLELLKRGLHEEFFEDARTMLVPFMDPSVYGRSILENSSFIACSANPDVNTRGRGFVARLSGATAEFIHMWLLMTIGRRPFSADNGGLTFEPSPVLPGDWFTRDARTVRWDDKEFEIPENSFACALLGTILLVYHNPTRTDTYGEHAVRPVRFSLDGGQSIPGDRLGVEFAERIRQRTCQRIDIWLE